MEAQWAALRTWFRRLVEGIFTVRRLSTYATTRSTRAIRLMFVPRRDVNQARACLISLCLSVKINSARHSLVQYSETTLFSPLVTTAGATVNRRLRSHTSPQLLK